MTDRTGNDLFNERVCDINDGPLKRYNELRAASAEDLIAAILPAESLGSLDPYNFDEWVRAQIRAAYADGLTLSERNHIWDRFVYHERRWVGNFLINLRPKILGYSVDVYHPAPEKLANWFQPATPAKTTKTETTP